MQNSHQNPEACHKELSGNKTAWCECPKCKKPEREGSMNWIMRFDEAFPDWILQDNNEVYRSFEIIKSFISQTIAQEKEDWEAGRDTSDDYEKAIYNKGYNDGLKENDTFRQEMVEKIRAMKNDCDKCDKDTTANEALDQVLALLKA